MDAYTELPGFEELVLEESYVLGIRALPGEVSLEMDLVLTREHPLYVSPADGEVECFRRGTLRFSGVKRLVWNGQGRPPARDASGDVDFGHVDSFEWQDGHFVLSGDFGEMDLHADTAAVAL